MKKPHTKLALAAITGAVLFASGITAGNAADLQAVAKQPTIVGELSSDTDGIYIVRLKDEPIATYDGGIRGLDATSARSKGKKRLDTNSKSAKKYEKYLKEQQKAVLGNAGKAFGRALDTKFEYQHAINGFAVELTVDEAKALRNMDGVVSVQRERMEQLNTDVGPEWISAPSIWSNQPSSTKGEGVVVAVLDSGINSDHPSFADIGGDGYDHTNPLGSGNYLPGSYCDTTDPTFCNDKLIGAYSFVPGDDFYPVPEDSDGHGSHTASTVAGNVVLGAELDAPTTTASFDISGVAPHANMVIYDVCIDSCPGSALVAAINQVVIDAGNLPNGIAALNYSISGGGNPYNDTVELGFLAAVEAGVYVSASAGNSGPDASTVAHLGPWVSTTAASTHNRTIVNSLVDIDGSGGPLADIDGTSFSAGYGPAPIIHANTTAFDPAGQCLNPFPPGTFDGEIVVCDRGSIARVAKGANVLAGGAGGFVLANLGQGESTVADPHFLPAIHIGDSDADVLRAWLAANTDTVATITPYNFDYDPANGDVMAGFSSRGPQLAFDVNKPDLTAPGVNVMGADSDNFGQYQIISGTSMSSPHNAGSGALMTALRPDLNPVEIKSALMLSASTEFMVKEDGVTPADAFDHGAGRVDLHAAKQAGLVMDISAQEFLDANPDSGGDPSALNLPSMMNSSCVGSCSWTRTVSNPEKSTSHWNVTTSGPEGLALMSDLSPEADSDDYNLKLKKGQSAEITVTADTAFAPEGWHFASLNLDRNLDKGPDLHMPIAVYATKASNANVFTKTVDADVATAGDILTYEINVTNGPMTGPITVTDVLPEGTTFVPASETEVVNNGSTTSAWSYDSGSNTVSWTGELDQAGIVIEPAALFGYFPLASLGVPPFAVPGGCDEGGWLIGGLDIWYNGLNYTDAIWSVNGTVELGQESFSATGWVNQPMPSPSTPNNLLAPLWSDMNLCDAGTPGGGNWYLATLSAGPQSWDVFEWAAVPEWPGAGNGENSYQIWLERGTSNITYTYGTTTAFFATIGAENADGTIGDMTYFNGGGTPAAPGDELGVFGTPGGSATLGFQVEADCSSNVVNRANLSGSAGDETAIAATACE